MVSHLRFCAVSSASMILFAGCTSPFDETAYQDWHQFRSRTMEHDANVSLLSDQTAVGNGSASTSINGTTSEEFIRYALEHNPDVAAAFHQWRTAAERSPQAGALPDPKLTLGVFLDEVETRVGPQQARLGISQSFPWPGTLRSRADAASRAADAAWLQLESTRLRVRQRVVNAIHELAYLDAATHIASENLDLLQSIEEIVRAKYRVGTGSHPQLMRVQVELGQLEDRLVQLHSMRPAYTAELNAALNRAADSDVPELPTTPTVRVDADAESLITLALQYNQILLSLDKQTEQQHLLVEAARLDGLPQFTAGIDYIFTGEAMDSSIAESGDDPVMVSLGVSLPLWREKYNAGVREAFAKQLSLLSERQSQSNSLAARIHRVYFDHTDADRRAALYQDTLIPKAEESLQATLTGFRAGESSLTDVLDTERTLLDFAIALERARADQNIAFAELESLVGTSIPTRSNGQVQSEVKP
ncbi:MAG: TolC family protein [Phycisphaeraceae bacterium]|nr:TolC family protein [Phycisphaerales bacterium]MCB9860375.1 TolC family protein [Phycisphaeraceae bacterium]